MGSSPWDHKRVGHDLAAKQQQKVGFGAMATGVMCFCLQVSRALPGQRERGWSVWSWRAEPDGRIKLQRKHSAL